MNRADAFSPAARRVAGRLREAGYSAYFVGGCVRDLLAGETPHDVDLATSARPGEVLSLFPGARAVGAAFGVVLVSEGGETFEVATFREDGAYSDGRRPDSVRFATAREDVLRRDFTVNGLLMDPATGEIIDYVGGVRDGEQGLIRAIGDPRARFAEDALRLLRAVRFAATKKMTIEPATWEALCAAAPSLCKISAERIRSELDRMWLSPHRVRALKLLDASGLLAVILPELGALKGTMQSPRFHPEGDVWEHTVRVFGQLPSEVGPALAWAALLHDVGKPASRTVDARGETRFCGHERVGATMAAAILCRLKYPVALVAAVRSMIAGHGDWRHVRAMRPGKLRFLMSSRSIEDEILLHRADCLGGNGDLSDLEWALNRRGEWAAEGADPPKPLVNGDDLIALGCRPGPSFRLWLDEAYIEQLEGRFTDRKAALAWVKKRLAGEGAQGQ